MKVTPEMLAIFLTAGGAMIGATGIWALIDAAKTSPLAFLVAGRERLVAFILSAVLIVLSFVSGVIAVPPTQTIDLYAILGALVAWYALARLAMTVHDDVNRYTNSLTGPSAPPPSA